MAFQCLIIVAMASKVVSVVLLIHIVSGVDASQEATCNVTCTYTAWAADANCRNLGLTQVPQGCNSSEMVDLRNNELQFLRQGSFAGYRLLRYLDLEFNLIAYITRGAFQGCVSLQNIYLQFNILTGVGEGVFEGATDLKRLFLNQNRITDIHPDAFRGLSTLEGLYIGHNDITDLPVTIFRHTPLLKYLHMGDNGIKLFPLGIFDVLTDLRYLNVENNNLQFVNGSLFKHLTSLEELNLSGNRINSITDFPTLPTLKILDLYDNNLQDIGNLPEKVGQLDQLYLNENDDLRCTCSVNPVREWVIIHQTDEDVDSIKANVTCGWPQKFRGFPLSILKKELLCPTFGLAPPALPAEITTVRITEQNNIKLPPAEQDGTMSSSLNPITVYVLVGGATLATIILVLIVLIKCLDWYTRRYRQQQQEVKRRQRPTQPQHREQNAPMIRITPNRQIQDDDGAYEPVRLRPHSPMSDSAFGSQDDVNAVEEAREWQDPIYRVPSYASDHSGELHHPYPPMREWNASDLQMPTDEEITRLARDLRNNNPFIDDKTQEAHAVLKTEGVPYLKRSTTPYMSHTEFAEMQSDSTKCKKNPSSLTPDQTPDQSPDQTPDQSPEHIPKRCAPEIPRRQSTNPFSTNPFISCA